MHDDFDEEEMFTKNAAIARPVAPMAAPVIPVAPTNPNPLAQYFRAPGLSVKLPTGGRYLPKGAIEFDSQGQVEVFPMRGADEVLLKSPDALMSGLAIERMIGSCVPALKLPALISAPDLDVLLLAIRAATFGNTMQLDIDCPKCGHDNSFDCDLPSILATMTPFPDVLELRLAPEVIVTFKPHTLDEQTRLLISAYEQNRSTQLLDSEDSDLSEEEKQNIMRKALKTVEHLQHVSLSNAIQYITVPGATVTDRKYIIEFLANAANTWLSQIRDKIEEVNMLGLDRSVHAKCTKCEHEWTAQIEFNPATFFAQSS
jgi:hypothetical protein